MIINLSDYPLLQANQETPFMQELIGAYTEGGKAYVMSVNGQPMARAIWNLLISHRDLKGWCGKWKMKPTRRWQVSQVKHYFGIKGNGQNLLKRFEALKEEAERMVENISSARPKTPAEVVIK